MNTCSKCNSNVESYYTVNGVVVCDNCFNLQICLNCGTATDILEDNVCSDCHEVLYVKCCDCDEIVDVNEAFVSNGDIYCGGCRDKNFSLCGGCSSYFDGDDMTYVDCDDDSYCGNCYDNRFTSCTECGTPINRDDAEWDSHDDAYCDECFSNRPEDSIREYDYKPEPKFYGNGLFMGIELEIDGAGECQDSATNILDIANEDSQNIYCKHDGSLDDGFEIVTHPMSLEYHTDSMPWEAVMKKAKKMGYKSHDAGTCGLHIHVGREFLGDGDGDKEDATITNILYFYEHFWSKIVKFSRRTTQRVEEWARRYNYPHLLKDNGNELLKYCKSNRTKYTAVNLSPYYTIEFRIFRGTLNHTSFLATLQFTHELVTMCKKNSFSTISELTWSDFIGRIKGKYKELDTYLASRGLLEDKLITLDSMRGDDDDEEDDTVDYNFITSSVFDLLSLEQIMEGEF